MNAVHAGLLAATLAALGWHLRWLTAAGALAAALVGAAVFTGGGIGGGMMLALFFTSGSLLSRAGSQATPGQPGHESRTARQVLANGGWAAAGALALLITPAGWAVLGGALAAAQADTWATEFGTRSRQAPRLITTFSPVAPGVSGGITFLGTAAGVSGACVMAAVAHLTPAPAGVSLAALVAGIVGMLVDSLLGATLQARFHCAPCDAEDESRVHGCGRPATHRRGLPWLDNDMVNLLGTATGAAVALAWWSAA